MTTRYQPGTRVSEYLLEECVGAGTFGEVWRARHHVWDSEHVAVKLPTEPEYVRFLRREGVVVHGLRHPNIIRVMGLDPYAETPYLVMELVRGPSLREVIDAHPQGLPIDVALLVIRGVLRAMATAHEANVIHRDLKPGNVLLNLGEGELTALNADDVKVGDFGLGIGDPDTLRSMVMQSGSIQRDQESGTIAGTLAYMAPELRDSGNEPTPRADLYSIGVMLFEMLTGERPAGAELPSTVRAEVPAALDDVFRKLYARFDRRYEHAQDVLNDLDASVDASGAPVLPPLPEQGGVGTPPPPPRGSATDRCSGCDAVLNALDQFCTQCGQQVSRQVRRCPKCDAYPATDDNYCIMCGTMLAAAE